MEYFVLVVLVLAVIVLFLRQRGRKAERSQLAVLSEHVANLERRMQAMERGAVAPMPQAAATAAYEAQVRVQPVAAVAPAVGFKVAAPIAMPVAAPRFIPAPPPVAKTPPVAKPAVSLEERLGKNWLSKLGIVAVVIGIALFLGPQLRNLGPLGKSVVGMVLSLVILGGGVFLERKERYRTFARAGIGGGWALTFFVTFALYHLPAMQVIHSQGLDLVLMMVVAAAMVAHSLRYRSQVVTSLAFLLAFVTVGISEVTLFSLVAGALLAAGLIYVAYRERWFELALAGLVGVYLNHFLWLHRVLPDGAVAGHPFVDFVPSAALLLLYWLLFRLFYIFRVPEGQRQSSVATLTAVLNSVGLLALLKYQSAHPEWAFYGLLGLGAAELGLAFVARRRNHTAFVVLAIVASGLLLAAVPFRFSGSNWSLLWLLEAEILFLAGIALGETVFRRLGMAAALATTVQIFLTGVAPVFELREAHPDATHHVPVAIALFCAGALFWANAEVLTRRFDFLRTEEVDSAALTVTSYFAALAVGAGLWVVVPGAWTIVAWLALALAVSFAADKTGSRDLATQADVVALAGVLRAIALNLQLSAAHGGHLSTRAVTVTLAAAMLYLQMRRRTRAQMFTVDYVPAAYSWAAAGLLSLLLWYELQPAATGVAWGVFGLVLFELGLTLRKNFLRHQGCALLAASFVRIYFVNLTLEPGARLYTVLPLIAAYFWVYERARSSEDASTRFGRAAASVAAWLGMGALASLAYFAVRAAWVGMAWAALALVAMGLAWWLRRNLLLLQAMVLLVAAGVRAMLFNLFAPTPLAVSFITGRTFCIGATCVLMLLALPPAFAMRRRRRAEMLDRPAAEAGWKSLLFGRPEQMFFFVPLALVTVLLAVQLRAGMITIAWSVLGLGTFLFALMVAERSFRLAGLGLLMLCVGKILFVDVWHATPTDRYITLIVLGVALLSVSFLYSRYRESILKLL